MVRPCSQNGGRKLPKIALNWMRKQKRTRGRQKKNWMEGIRKAINERKLNEGERDDRKQWSVAVGQRRKSFETNMCTFFFLRPCDPTRVMASSFLMFLDHTQRPATVGRTPLDEWSARRRDLYLTTHNRQTSMSTVGFEPTAGERPQTYALDRAATATGILIHCGRVTQICVFNTVKLGTSASSP